MTEFSIHSKTGLPRHKIIKAFLTGILFILLIATIQDLLHSRRNNYTFYLSESLLFNTFWLWFFPLTFLQIFIFRKADAILHHQSVYIRIAAFVFSASVIHALLYAVSVLCISALLYETTYTLPKMLSYTLANDFYKYIFIYSVTGFLYFKKGFLHKEQPLQPISKEESRFMDAIIAGTGRNHVIIPVQDIIYITSTSPYISIHTRERKYLHLETLKSIIGKLNDDQFIQVHKSAIVNLNSVVSYRSRLNGDYDILLKNREEVRLSRNYAASFRKKFRQDSSA